MARPSKRFALFLCLIVLHNDFIQARSSYYNGQILMTSNPSSHRQTRSSLDILLEDRHDFDDRVREVESRHGVSLRHALGRPIHREKRLFGLILFIVSIVVTVVATTIETIYDIAGCCGLGYSYLCGFEANYNRRKDNVTKQSEVVDRRLQDALERRDDLNCLADVLKTIWLSINEHVKLQETLVGFINPHFKNMVDSRFRKTMENINNATTIVNENDITELFEKLTSEELALKLSLGWSAAALPGLGYLGQKAYKSFKINKYYKALKATKLDQVVKAAPKARKLIGFTESSAKVFLKNTAILKFSNKAGSFLKAMKFFKVAGAIMSVVSIVVDLFNIITTFVACGDKQKKAKETCKQMEEAEQKVDNAFQNVTDFENLLKTGLEAKLLEELRNPDFQSALENIRDTIENLPPQNTDGQRQKERDIDIEYCNDAIPEFLTMVNRTSVNIKEVKDALLDIADNCIDKLNFAYKCLIARKEINSMIEQGCTKGSDTFENLLDTNKNTPLNKIRLAQCFDKGEPYTTDQMYKEALEAKATGLEGVTIYTENCLMNKKENIDAICKNQKVSGFTAEQIQKVQSEMCEGGQPPKITKEQEEQICLYINSPFFTDDEAYEALQSVIIGLTREEFDGYKPKCQAAA